ncbi:SH3-like domain-containing protein [Enterovirga rhinocerotis]|uniref:Nitrile hydratase beta subunit n=1 Tax=Enterovirga rhinocerotis TaxID=1339210 RepID=A0A4R7C7G6_9HYPH|nr:SH3-like domain-containing protein [Enterovirga rhinocerotis]TDR94338.1 nitrile hydratase beta subunit [Enterovirga rhinocerotis]
MAEATLEEERPRAHHDLGGVPRFLCEEIDIEPHELTDFDRQVDALRQLLSAKELMTVDELRRGIEEIPEEDYLRLSYYQKWIRSITATLIRRGVLTAEDVAARIDGASR